MLTATELEAMRDTAELALPDTATIQRGTSVADGYGGQTITWATVETVACRISPSGQARGEERIIGGSLASTAAWTLTFHAHTDIRTGDQIVADSRTFEVVQVLDRSWEITRRVYCNEVAP